MINIKCCKGCPDRKTGDQDCHKDCERYLKAKKLNDEVRERIRTNQQNKYLVAWKR